MALHRSLQDTDILNTAVLSGRTVAVPVRVVAVAADGALSDVTESVECRSTEQLVIKVRVPLSPAGSRWNNIQEVEEEEVQSRERIEK